MTDDAGNGTAEHGTAVRISLVEDQGDGEAFLADICRMVESIARRSGVALAAEAQAANARLPSRTYSCPGRSSLPEALLAEVGYHRAQIVPKDSKVGRIMTSRVMVEAAPFPNQPSPSVVSTYNYIQRRVSRHTRGDILALEQVLAGQS